MTITDEKETVATIDQQRLTHLLGYRLTRTELQVRRRIQECMGQFDLKPVDYSILVLVDANPGINQRQLAEILDVSPPNLAIVIGRLVKRGLLHQVRGRQDRRMQHLYLSPPGAALIEKAERAVRHIETQLMEQLGDQHGQALLSALDRLEDLT